MGMSVTNSMIKSTVKIGVGAMGANVIWLQTSLLPDDLL